MKQKKLLIPVLLLMMLFANLNGNAQTTYTIGDTIICTSVDNVKKTVLKIRTLNEEKRIAINIAAESEVENEGLKKAVRKIERKIAIQKFWKPFKETGKAAVYGTIGFFVAIVR